MGAFWSHPAVVSTLDSLEAVFAALSFQVRQFEPVTWMLLALVVATVWMFMMRPPA